MGVFDNRPGQFNFSSGRSVSSNDLGNTFGRSATFQSTRSPGFGQSQLGRVGIRSAASESALGRARSTTAAERRAVARNRSLRRRTEARISDLRQRGRIQEANRLQSNLDRETSPAFSAARESLLAQSRLDRKNLESQEAGRSGQMGAWDMFQTSIAFRAAVTTAVDAANDTLSAFFKDHPDIQGIVNPGRFDVGMAILMLTPGGDLNRSPYAFSFSPYVDGELEDV